MTFNSLGDYRQNVYDVESGGVVSYVNLMENHEFPFPDLLSVRLKVVDHQITEIETTVSRHQPNAFGNLPPTQEWRDFMNRKEPAETRLSREELVEGAIAYMRSVAFHDGDLAPYADSCIRLENGNITAIGPNDVSPVPVGSGPPGSTTAPVSAPAEESDVKRPELMGIGCGAQLEFMVYSFITGFGDAHVPVVDVERQLAFASFNFQRRGDVETWTYEGNTFPMGERMRYPNEVLNTAIFKFVDGKISRVETVIGGLQAYGRGTGWPGGAPAESRPIGE